MAEIFQLDDMNKFQNCAWEWDQTPFYEQWPGLEENHVGTGPSHGHEGSYGPVLLQGQQGNPMPGLNYSQEENPAEGPAHVQRGNPWPDPLKEQQKIPVSLPFCGRFCLQHGNPVPSPSIGAGNSTVNSRKRTRTAFTTYQLQTLEEAYTVSKFCSSSTRAHLHRLLNVDERVIKVWFQNRRMKEKNVIKEKQGSGEISSFGNPQPVHSTQNNYYTNGCEYSSSLSQYWQTYGSHQNEYLVSGDSGNTLRAEIITTQSALTVENVQNRRSNYEATSTYCEDYVNNHLLGINNEPSMNQPALSGTNCYQRLSSNELTTSYQEMYVPRECQDTALENGSASTVEAKTQSSFPQERRASNVPTTSFGETFEPRHYNVRVSYDSATVSEIETSESSNSPQSSSNPRKPPNKRKRCRVTTTKMRVSESCKSLSSNEEKSEKQSNEKWNEAIIKEDTYEHRPNKKSRRRASSRKLKPVL